MQNLARSLYIKSNLERLYRYPDIGYGWVVGLRKSPDIFIKKDFRQRRSILIERQQQISSKAGTGEG